MGQIPAVNAPLSFRMLATMRITDCSTAVSFRYFGATSITTCAETSFWDGVIPTVEVEEKAHWRRRPRTSGAAR